MCSHFHVFVLMATFLKDDKKGVVLAGMIITDTGCWMLDAAGTCVCVNELREMWVFCQLFFVGFLLFFFLFRAWEVFPLFV